MQEWFIKIIYLCDRITNIQNAILNLRCFTVTAFAGQQLWFSIPCNEHQCTLKSTRHRSSSVCQQQPEPCVFFKTFSLWVFFQVSCEDYADIQMTFSWLAFYLWNHHCQENNLQPFSLFFGSSFSQQKLYNRVRTYVWFCCFKLELIEAQCNKLQTLKQTQIVADLSIQPTRSNMYHFKIKFPAICWLLGTLFCSVLFSTNTQRKYPAL